MADQTSRSLRRHSAHARPGPEPATPDRESAERIERAVAQALRWALPLGTGLVAMGAAILFDVGSALLVLVTGALLGAILLLWYSLRSLAGDVPADPTLEAAIASHAPRSELDERKQRALRSLKDLEQEHAVGKIDDDDYKALLAEYRTQAKAVIREMDDVLTPYRAEAEALVRAHLAKRHIKSAIDDKSAKTAEPDAAPVADASNNDSSPAVDRVICSNCDTVNDSDAAFCKRCGTKLGEGVTADGDSPEADT